MKKTIILAVISIFFNLKNISASQNCRDTIIISELCMYINKPIKDLVCRINKEIVDTIARRTYIGTISSVVLILRNGDCFEIFPANKRDYKFNKELREGRFRISLIEDLSLKKVIFKKENEIIKSCDSDTDIHVGG